MRGEQRWNTERTMGTKGIKLRAEKKCNERNYLDGRLMRMKEVRMQGAHARAAPRTQTCARSPAHATCLSNNTITWPSGMQPYPPPLLFLLLLASSLFSFLSCSSVYLLPDLYPSPMVTAASSPILIPPYIRHKSRKTYHPLSRSSILRLLLPLFYLILFYFSPHIYLAHLRDPARPCVTLRDPTCSCVPLRDPWPCVTLRDLMSSCMTLPHLFIFFFSQSPLLFPLTCK